MDGMLIGVSFLIWTGTIGRGCAVAIIATMVVGCRSTDGLSEEARRIKAESYEYVRTTGSHIPQRVRRGEAPRGNEGASPVAVLEGEKARETVRQIRRGP